MENQKHKASVEELRAEGKRIVQELLDHPKVPESVKEILRRPTPETNAACLNEVEDVSQGHSKAGGDDYRIGNEAGEGI